MKRALGLLCNNKSEDPDTIKNEFLKNGRSNCNFTKVLFPTNSTIRGYTVVKIKKSLIIKGVYH